MCAVRDGSRISHDSYVTLHITLHISTPAHTMCITNLIQGLRVSDVTLMYGEQLVNIVRAEMSHHLTLNREPSRTAHMSENRVCEYFYRT